MVLGVAFHLHGTGMPAAFRDILGDALWAVMIVWWVSVVVPAARTAWRAGAAYAFCVAVELSQLVQLPALDAVRHTTLGHLVIGSDYDTRDLMSYAIGVLVAIRLDLLIRAR